MAGIFSFAIFKLIKSGKKAEKRFFHLHPDYAELLRKQEEIERDEREMSERLTEKSKSRSIGRAVLGCSLASIGSVFLLGSLAGSWSEISPAGAFIVENLIAVIVIYILLLLLGMIIVKRNF